MSVGLAGGMGVRNVWRPRRAPGRIVRLASEEKQKRKKKRKRKKEKRKNSSSPAQPRSCCGTVTVSALGFSGSSFLLFLPVLLFVPIGRACPHTRRQPHTLFRPFLGGEMRDNNDLGCSCFALFPVHRQQRTVYKKVYFFGASGTNTHF